jgi:hypothetical protein
VHISGVFAAVSSYLILGEHLSSRELTGCACMLAATLLAEVGLPCLKKSHGHGHGGHGGHGGHSIAKSGSDNDVSSAGIFSIETSFRTNNKSAYS